jgi:glycosyltransferase involved in cell wall biosynthesis
MKRLISVVIPAYKAASFIERTLSSVFAQTCLPAEVVVVDDASPDETAAVVNSVARNAPVLVRLIRLSKNSGGPARPMNIGVKAANCELIAALDHDDLMDEQRLEAQLSVFELAESLGIVVGRVECQAEQDGRASPAWESPDFTSLFATAPLAMNEGIIPRKTAHSGLIKYGCYALTCSAISFSKSAWAAVGGFDERNATCIDFAFLAAATARYELGYTNAVVVRWNSYAGSLYKTAQSERRLRDALSVYSIIDTRLLDRDVKRLYAQQLRDQLLGWAFRSREAGQYGHAALGYWRSMRWGGGRAGLIGLAKLLPHYLGQRLRGVMLANNNSSKGEQRAN